MSNANADRLVAAYGSWQRVAEAEIETLTACLQTATFPRMAAERLRDCLQAIIAERGGVSLDHLADLDTAEAMAWLERLPGVARKISAGMMNQFLEPPGAGARYRSPPGGAAHGAGAAQGRYDARL